MKRWWNIIFHVLVERKVMRISFMHDLNFMIKSCDFMPMPGSAFLKMRLKMSWKHTFWWPKNDAKMFHFELILSLQKVATIAEIIIFDRFRASKWNSFSARKSNFRCRKRNSFLAWKTKSNFIFEPENKIDFRARKTKSAGKEI